MPRIRSQRRRRARTIMPSAAAMAAKKSGLASREDGPELHSRSASFPVAASGASADAEGEPTEHDAPEELDDVPPADDEDEDDEDDASAPPSEPSTLPYFNIVAPL